MFLKSLILSAAIFWGPFALGQSVAADKSPTLQVIKVSLRDRIPDGKHALRWSPKGAKLLLTETVDGQGKGLSGALTLDGGRTPSFKIGLSKSIGTQYFDRLWIDKNHDGVEDPGEISRCQPKETRKKFWSSFPDVVLSLGPAQSQREYSLSFWFVYDPKEPQAKKILRWSRRGWHQGTFQLGENKMHIYIADAHLDGIFDLRDSWFLAPSADDLFRSSASRRLNDHAWLGERAFRVSSLDTAGKYLVLEEFKPSTTAAAEAESRNRFAKDMRATRASQPLVFLKDLEVARAQAKKRGRDLLIDFETTWCGPCKAMDRWVYSSKAIVDRAKKIGLTVVKIDGDERSDLKEKFKVVAYPTMIILAADGSEKARAQGYQSIAKLLVLLGSSDFEDNK